MNWTCEQRRIFYEMETIRKVLFRIPKRYLQVSGRNKKKVVTQFYYYMMHRRQQRKRVTWSGIFNVLWRWTDENGIRREMNVHALYKDTTHMMLWISYDHIVTYWKTEIKKEKRKTKITWRHEGEKEENFILHCLNGLQIVEKEIQ